MTRPARRLVVLLVAVCVLAVGAGFLARGFVSPAQEAARAAAPPQATLTAPVQYRVLAATVVFRADVADASPVVASVPTDVGADLPVVTFEGSVAGRAVSEGEVVAAVAGRPLVVGVGPIPAYRSMAPGDQGVDVTELRAMLVRLGYSCGVDRPGMYGYGTEQAVRALYAHLGYPPALSPPSADTDLAKARGAVSNAQASVVAAQRAYASDAAAGAPVAARDADVAAFNSAVAQVNAAQASVTALQETTGATVPLGEVVFAPALPTKILSFGASLGGTVSVGGGSAVFTLGSGKVTITGAVGVQDQPSLHRGQAAAVSSDITGQHFPALIASVAATVGASQSATGPSYAVTLSSSGDLSGLIGQNVGVSVQTASSGTPTFVVPLAAVTTSAGGASTVSVTGPHGAERVVAVRVGLTSGGDVGVTPTAGGLSPGDQVLLGVAANG